MYKKLLVFYIEIVNFPNLINETKSFLDKFVRQFDLYKEIDNREENQIIKGEMLIKNCIFIFIYLYIVICQNNILIINSLREEILYRFHFIISFSTLIYYIIKRIPSKVIEVYMYYIIFV